MRFNWCLLWITGALFISSCSLFIKDFKKTSTANPRSTLETATNCPLLINECDKKKQSIQKIRQCLYKIDHSCKTKSLMASFKETHKNLRLKLTRLHEKQIVSPHIKGMCELSERWGYLKSYNTKARVIAYTQKEDNDFHGEFETEKECDRARMMEESYVETSLNCYPRYLGPNKTINLYEAVATSYDGKIPLLFKTLFACEEAVFRGLDYYRSGSKKIRILPLKESGENRFIKGCTTKEVLICERFKHGEQLERDIL